MIAVPSVPLFVPLLLRGRPGVWPPCHRLVRCGLLVMHVLFPGRQTLAALARWTPGALTVWRWRRVRQAAYGEVHRLGAWGAPQRCRPGHPPRTGHALWWGMAVSPPRGGHRSP